MFKFIKSKNSLISSGLDPLIGSAAMFLIQISILYFSTKSSFAEYSLSYSYIVMGQGILGALFGGPLITMLNRTEGPNFDKMLTHSVLKVQIWSSVILGALGTTIAMVFGIPLAITILSAIAMIGLSFKDSVRSILVANYDFNRALIISCQSAVITLIFVFLAIFLTGTITSSQAVIVVIISTFAVLFKRFITALLARSSMPKEFLRGLAGMAAWSVPGAIVIWVQNSLYLTLVALNLSMASVSEISAARMVAMPLLITASGLLRLFQVRTSHILRESGPGLALQTVKKYALVVFLVGALLSCLVFSVGSSLPIQYLPQRYPNIILISAGWFFFAAMTTVRGLYSAFYQAMGRYREIFVLNTLVVPLVIVGLLYAPQEFGLLGAIFPMAFGELLLACLLILKARRRGQI